MLELLLSQLPTILSVVFGGGVVTAVVKLYTAWRSQSRKDDAQDHEQEMELSDRLESRLSKVEGRLDSAEEELRKTRRELTQSQLRREELQAAISALTTRIDRLIDRLEQHESITQEERQRLTSVPYSNTRSESNDTPSTTK